VPFTYAEIRPYAVVESLDELCGPAHEEGREDHFRRYLSAGCCGGTGRRSCRPARSGPCGRDASPSFAVPVDGSAARTAGTHRLAGRRQGGFVLGGGHAIGLHGMGDRPSEDIDLFSAERGSPAAVAGKLLDAEAREGFTVMISLRTADLVQMEVTDVKGAELQGRSRGLLAGTRPRRARGRPRAPS
jgi:hypothetical protein